MTTARPCRLTVVVAVVAALLGACDGDAATRGSVGAASLRGLSDIERTILADKDVTEAELEEAMDHQRSCLSAVPGIRGVEVTRNGAVVTAGAEYDDSRQTTAEAAVERCDREVHAVYAVALLLLGPSESDRRRATARLRRCASDAGVQVASDADAGEVIAAIASVRQGQDESPTPASVACVDDYNASVPAAEPGLAAALAELDLGT